MDHSSTCPLGTCVLFGVVMVCTTLQPCTSACVPSISFTSPAGLVIPLLQTALCYPAVHVHSHPFATVHNSSVQHPALYTSAASNCWGTIAGTSSTPQQLDRTVQAEAAQPCSAGW